MVGAAVGMVERAAKRLFSIIMGSPTKRIGILAAMPQEIAKLESAVSNQVRHKKGAVFEFVTGELDGRPVVYGAANVRALAL